MTASPNADEGQQLWGTRKVQLSISDAAYVVTLW